ncbi:MAG: hypothetical protein IIU32_00755, partial [Firmicutes bacterium]|nr:hypothetical protein [Bacillota bacterium]
HILGRGENLLTVGGECLLLFGEVLLTDGLRRYRRHLLLGCLETSLEGIASTMGDEYMRSLLYHPAFTTEFREAAQKPEGGR